MNLAANEPQLIRVLFGDGVEDEVETFKGFFELLRLEEDDHDVERKLMDVKRAKTNIGEIRLAAPMTLHIGVFIFVLNLRRIPIRELVFRIELLVHMHYPRRRLQISQSFFVIARINVQNSSVQVVIFFVEYVLFVEVLAILAFFYWLNSDILSAI